MKRSLKTPDKILLLLIGPLLIQTIFLLAIMWSFDRLERDREREGQALDGLLHVNMTFNEMVSTAASLMMFSIWQEPGYLLEFNDKYTSLKQSSKELQKYTDPNRGGSKEVASLSGIIDDAIKTFESVDDMSQDSFQKDNVATIERLKSFLTRMDTAGRSALEEQMATRKKYGQGEAARRQQLITVIQFGIGVNFAIAAVCGFLFAGRFANRFQVLMEHTRRIASGQRLERSLDGTDELANLDHLIHTLSFDLEAARQMERAMIDNTAEIICSLDDAYKLQEINRAVIKRLGYEPAELIGTNIQSIVHPDDRDETYRELEYSKKLVEEITFETRLKHKDGRFTFTEWNIKWSPENKSMFCIMHDITERKEAEKLKQEVIAMVSHDLRAPLTSLGVTLDMLTEGAVGDINERGNRMIGRAKYSVTSLIGMINDLIDVERFEAGGLKLNYEDVQSTDVITPAMDFVIAEADRKKIKLNTNIEQFELKVDKERLNRVVMNLINNAIKFTPEGRNIVVTCKLLQSKSGRPYAEIQVIDEGPGIAQDKLELVFEKFKQAGTGSEGERVGSGLGLAICKAIVEAHHGDIGVTSQLGEGSTFWFKVPQAPTSQAESLRIH